MTTALTPENLLGPSGPGLAAAMGIGLHLLDGWDTPEKLARVGEIIGGLPGFEPIAKSVLPDSYGGGQSGPSDDFLVGRGLFYLSERGRLFLDLTSGHYQMLWGYNHPELMESLAEASRAGVTWDNHSNIPQGPLKWLGHRLVEIANAPGEADPLDTVHLGVCTGSVACATALKIQLKVFERDRAGWGVPVIVGLEGNYHGTDMVPQFMRGMWPGLVRSFELLTLPPNDLEALERVFGDYGRRIAGFWAEPIMMNREALALDPAYLARAEGLCRGVGALLCLDEIQTGFWQPEIFEYRRWGLRPDLVVLGKGMTAGFHPLSGVLFRSRHDVLAQYDAISTNGSAALPAYAALGSLALIAASSDSIRAIGRRIQEGFAGLTAEFPSLLAAAHGRGHLAGLKFREVSDAQRFHRRLLEQGLWTRVHAYHAGHSTILTKLGLLTDGTIVEFVLDRFRQELRTMEASVGGGAGAGAACTIGEKGG